ncbi:hypothetical protein BST61_g7715 [Cercospora zeina]
MAIELENKKQYDELIASTPTVIVFAHANYTANSRTFKSHFVSAAEEQKNGKVAFAWYDAFDADDVNAELVVRTFPAYFVFRDGKRVKSVLSSLATTKQLDEDVAGLVG